jgi:tRNA-dihydrouridine synthase B
MQIGTYQISPLQIAGADPKMMAEAARHNVDNGAQIIDINMGCPAKKVCNVMAGSALMQDEKLVGKILDAVVSRPRTPGDLEIPHRLEPDQPQRADHRAHRRSGRHPRRRHPRPHALPAIHRRGRIRHHRHSARLPTSCRPDNCWLHPIDRKQRGVLLGHLRALYEFYGPEQGLRIARKHLGWYAGQQGESTQFRARVNDAQDITHQYRAGRTAFRAVRERSRRQAFTSRVASVAKPTQRSPRT